MTPPTLDDFWKTYTTATRAKRREIFGVNDGSLFYSDVIIKAGLTAVIKAMEPVIAKACARAMASAFPEDYQGDKTEQQIAEAITSDYRVAAEIAAAITAKMMREP